MKIAFTAKGDNWDAKMDPRFGRTDYLLIYDEDADELTGVDNRKIAEVAHGAGPQTAQKLFEMAPEVLLTGNGPGGNAASVLQRGDLKIYIGAGEMTVKEAYEAFKAGNLKEFS